MVINKSTLNSIQKRTKLKFLKAWDNLASQARAFSGEVSPSFPKSDQERIKNFMELAKDNRFGDHKAIEYVIELARIYISLNDQGRKKFLLILATDFDINRNYLTNIMHQYLKETSLSKKICLESDIKDALEAPRRKILTNFGSLPYGMKFLIDLRADLLKFAENDYDLNALERDLRDILTSWFDYFFLELKELDWDFPASLLEKIIVRKNSINNSLENFRKKLDNNHKCLAFFHPKLPKEPIILVECMLSDKVPESINDLEQDSLPVESCNHVIFYSMDNLQDGLKNIYFSSLIIKNVISYLTEDYKNLKKFYSFSSLPNFSQWLNPILQAGDEGILLSEEKESLRKMGSDNAAISLYEILQNMDWFNHQHLIDVVKPILIRLAAKYLHSVKDFSDKTLPFDNYSKFHLFNGSILDKLCFMADLSPARLKESYGIMVIYNYNLDKLEENIDKYKNGQINMSNDFTKLVK